MEISPNKAPLLRLPVKEEQLADLMVHLVPPVMICYVDILYLERDQHVSAHLQSHAKCGVSLPRRSGVKAASFGIEQRDEPWGTQYPIHLTLGIHHFAAFSASFATIVPTCSFMESYFDMKSLEGSALRPRSVRLSVPSEPTPALML